MNTPLSSFIHDALQAGSSKAEITTALQSAGWDVAEVHAALDIYADVPFRIPVPKRKPSLSAREAFFYLVMFATLYISSISFGSILFDFVNHWLPDPSEYGYMAELTISSLRGELASLIVAFPIFYGLAIYLRKMLGKRPEKRESGVRKWLTYMTLFIAAGVIIGDLIAVLSGLLGGELTARFTAKVLIVFLIAVSIFGYYLWDLRTDEKEA